MNSSTAMPLDKRVYLAGEGFNELGSWAWEIPYQDGSIPGVLETLLKKVKDAGWQITYGKKWKDIRKYAADENLYDSDMKGDEQSVYRAIFEANENGCHVLAFSRDIDGKKDYQIRRMSEIEKAISQGKTDFPTIGIIGGCARPAIEGWILAFSGVRGTEKFSKDKAEKMLLEKLSQKGITSQNTQGMVEFVVQYNRTDVADDAQCLNKWLNNAEEIL